MDVLAGTHRLDAYRTKPSTKISGGAKQDRTADLLNANQALSQLSYSPISYLTEATSRIKTLIIFLRQGICWACLPNIKLLS